MDWVGLVAHSRIAGRLLALLAVDGFQIKSGGRLLLLARLVVEGGQGPAPAGELAGDRGVGDGVLLLPGRVLDPLVVQTLVAGMSAYPSRWGGLFPSGPHDWSDGVAGLVVPGSLDEQASGVGVAGVLPVLVIPPCLRESPLECSLGTSPR